ncbi:MAG: zinc-ribbon domain-containing protein [Actinomycetota bacterium]
MRCPSCDAEIADEGAAFCSRCGAPLEIASGEVTAKLRASESKKGKGTEEFDESPPPEEGGPAPPISEFGTAVRRTFAAGGWADVALAGVLALLAVLLVGAILLIAAKLQSPNLGAGAGPVSVLTAIVILALGSLGVPVHIDEIVVSALPLGALAACGLAIAWAAGQFIQKRDAHSIEQRALEGAKLGLPLALLCWVVALIFRFGGDHTVAASASWALVLGATWGALFGALGAARVGIGLRALIGRGAALVKERSRHVYEGVVAGCVMLVVSAVLGAGAALVWLIAGLASGGPSAAFGAGDALAAVVYIAAFAPNIIAAVVAIALGAPIEIGAQVTIRGRLAGPRRELSLWEWAGGAPWFAYLLMLIPALACLIGGFTARRSAPSGSKPYEVLGVAAATFAVVLALLAWVGRARLGAELVTARGFGLVAAGSIQVLLFGFAWAALFGYLGWRLAGGRA